MKKGVKKQDNIFFAYSYVCNEYEKKYIAGIYRYLPYKKQAPN